MRTEFRMVLTLLTLLDGWQEDTIKFTGRSQAFDGGKTSFWRRPVDTDAPESYKEFSTHFFSEIEKTWKK